MADRRGKVTPENREESRKLKALWLLYRAEGGLSQEDFGDTFHVGSQSAVTNMLNGHMAISLKAAKAFARGLDVEVKAFSPRLAAMMEEYGSSQWPLGDVVTPAVWADLPDSIKTKIQGNAELLVYEHRKRSGKSTHSQPNDGHKKAA